MSAFICGPDHLKVLAIFAVSTGSFGRRVDPRYIKRLPEATATLNEVALANVYADILYQENVRSVWSRYPNDKRGDLPGPVDDAGHVTITSRDMHNPALMIQTIKAAGLLKMCDCLEYQSCETDDYRQTVAFELLDNIRGAAIRCVPGYDDGPWDYYADEAKAA